MIIGGSSSSSEEMIIGDEESSDEGETAQRGLANAARDLNDEEDEELAMDDSRGGRKDKAKNGKGKRGRQREREKR